MPRRLPLACLLFAACDDYLGPGSGGGGGADRIDTILGLEGDATEGQALFVARCAACHDEAGVVDEAGPALGPLVPGLADGELVDVMINGKAPMPPVSLDDQGAADVLAFLRASFGGA